MRSSFWIAALVALVAAGTPVGRARVAGGQAGTAAAAASPPARNVRDLVARAGRYVADYGEKMSVVVGVEHYTQRMGGAGGAPPVSRELVSEFALVRVADDWVGFRDVFEVDGAAVRDRRDRIVTLLLDRSGERLLQGRRIADESARYNLGAVQRNFNTPTMALSCLHPKNQDRFRYTKAGEDTIDGARVWTVKYKEAGRPTIVRTTTGRDVPASGMFWIEPASGRVFRTRLELRTEVEPSEGAGNPDRSRRPVQTTAAITVSYTQDARLGLLLPSEMRESYEAAPAHRTVNPEPSTTITCVATYSDFRMFETFGRIIVR